jgi:hypothetical protein
MEWYWLIQAVFKNALDAVDESEFVMFKLFESRSNPKAL